MLSGKAGILKRWGTIFSLIFCVVSRITSQEANVEGSLEVAVEEINQAGNDEFIFKNYTGNVYSFKNTATEIRNLGKTLSDALGDNTRSKQILDKYSIMEITNDKDDDLYSAVIISLDKGSLVDHIRNLRQILAGFLQAHYNYKADEADTLAYFLSFYNARYRGDVEYLKSVYKPQVFNFINADNAGISLDYRDWPGKSRLIIPLTHESLVPLSQIGKEEVIDLTREKGENFSIKERDSLQDLRKKDVERRDELTKKKEEKITELQDVLKEKESEVRAEKSKVAEKNLAAEKKRLSLTHNRNRQGGILEKIEDRKDAQRAKNNAALLAEDVKKKELELIETRNQLDKQKRDKARNEEENKKILEDHSDEERRLKEDKVSDPQKKLGPSKPVPPKPAPSKPVPPKPAPSKPVPPKPAPSKPVPPKPAPSKPVPPKPAPSKPVPPKPQRSELEESDDVSSDLLIKDGKLYYMNISVSEKPGHYDNEIHIIDINKSEVIRSSKLDICSVNYMPYHGGLLVIRSREKNHEGNHSLAIIDLETLLPMLETVDDVNIHWDTPLSIIDGKIYSMISVDEKVFLARFNQELGLEIASSIEVNKSSSMVIVKDRIYVNSKGGKSIAIFDKDNLSKIGEIAIK